MGTLRFEGGRFIFEPDLEQTKELFCHPSNDEWEKINPDEYTTSNIQAAVAFRKYADKKTENFFNKVFVKHFPLPGLPQLTFLDAHQKEGVEWILTRSRSYLAHAPGAGKTCQAITAAFFTQGIGQVMFIVPPSLIENWKREWEKWAKHISDASFQTPKTISAVTSSDEKDLVDWGADFLIIPDSMLAKPWVYEKIQILDFKFIAVDEASRFKETSATRTLALFGGKFGNKTYRGLVHKPRHFVLMDGSPMPNRPMELWAPTYALSPESIDFLAPHDFGVKYCGGRFNSYLGYWEYKGSSNEAELKTRLQKSFMHVVPESALKHPERLRSILFMNTDPRSPEQKSWELKSIPMTNYLVTHDESNSQGELATYRKELGLLKVKWIASYVSDLLSIKNESILLFGWHREVLMQLATLLKKYNPQLVMGGTARDKREQGFEEFQRGERKLIIGNIQAMGRGHNLQRASRIIFGEYSWTEELNKQCEKRSSRKGNDNEYIRCEYIVLPGSLDERVLKSNFTKEKRSEKIIGV